MKTKAEVTPGDIEEMQMLVNSGDISLQEQRDAFKARMGRDTTLTDAELIIIYAQDDDGPSGDDWWAEQILAAEKLTGASA